jgi:hypothetical protein
MESIGLFFKVLWSPGEAMFRLSKSPRVLAPLLLIVLSSIGIAVVMTAKVDMAELTIRQLERTPQGRNVTDQQKDLMRQQMNLPVVKGFTFVTTIVGAVLMILVIAAIYFALFTMLGREGNFKTFFSITAYAFVPLIFRQIAFVIAIFVLPSSAIQLDELGSLSPAVFLDRDGISPVLFTAVNMIDLVNIWILILLTIGYGFVTRKSLSKVTRSGVVVGVFLVYAVLRLALAAVRGI